MIESRRVVPWKLYRGVELLLHVDRDSPLDVLVTITVVDPVEQFVEV